jgi:PAS domain S-box-containing protein
LSLAGLEADLREATDGATAARMVQEEAFDCVLLDYQLPDTDGLEFLRMVARVRPKQRVPVVMLTGHGNETIAVEAMKHGVHDYLVKDHMRPEALQRAILNAITVTRLRHEHDRVQEALQQQREWLEVTLASIGDGVIATDVQGVITFMNVVAASLTGWTTHEALGQPLVEVLQVIDETTRQPVESPVVRVLQQGQVVGPTHQAVLIARDGREVAIADSASPIRSSAGAMHGVVVVFRDISAQRQMEQEILRTRKIESVGVLAGGIAHDFNNLLTGIMGNISMAKMFANSDERILKRLAEAERACQRATALTQQLLTFSKGGTPVRQALYVAELLRESTAFALRDSNVHAVFNIAEDLVLVDADAGQLNRVIHNIVLNAAQAMPDGGTVRLEADNLVVGIGSPLALPEGRYLKIAITDHGCGIPADILPNIFDPYFTTKPTGTGLGLATAYAIVTKHDGYLTVTSRVGVGTTFAIYLPASEQHDVPLAPTSATPGAPGGRILVMDDDEAIRELLGDMLTSLGYEAIYVRDGAEVIEAYAQARAAGRPFAAVILDITVPGGMGGQEAMTHLRSIDPALRAIISSGYAHASVMAHFAQYGFSEVIVKPYTLERLRQVLQRVMPHTF